MIWQPGARQLASRLLKHGLHPLDTLLLHLTPRGHLRVRGARRVVELRLRAPAAAAAVGRLQGGGQVHEPLDLDAVAGAHVRDVVEVRGGRDQLGAAVGVPMKS